LWKEKEKLGEWKEKQASRFFLKAGGGNLLATPETVQDRDTVTICSLSISVIASDLE